MCPPPEKSALTAIDVLMVVDSERPKDCAWVSGAEWGCICLTGKACDWAPERRPCLDQRLRIADHTVVCPAVPVWVHHYDPLMDQLLERYIVYDHPVTMATPAAG